MGNSATKENTPELEDRVYTLDEFKKMIADNRDKVHNQMCLHEKYAKIFICEKETEQDKTDPDYLDNCEVDDICDDYKFQYYAAELKTKKTGYYDSISDMAWNNYHQVWSYSFDIYEMHRNNSTHKKLILKDYFTPKTRKGNHMTNDLVPIFDVIEKLTRDVIENKVIANLTEQSRLREIDLVNKKYGYTTAPKRSQPGLEGFVFDLD